MARQLPGGQIGRRGQQTTTVCPMTADEDRTLATAWLQSAIEAGQYRFEEADQDFPKKVWFEARGRIWCGYCVNPVSRRLQGLAD